MSGRWVLCVALLAGCPKYTTYGYDYRMSQQLGLSEDPTPPSVEARKLLQAAKTVAFYPPQGCLNTEMVNLGANSVEERRRMQELRASCGVLMSSLERAAESAGFEVMSWQNLNGQKRPIEYAREANVDVLFEINAFTPEQLDASQVKHTLSFFEVTDDKTLDITVNPVTARRCKNDADTSIKLQIAGYTGTIDIKTVSVVDGRDRWHYRRVQQVPVAERHDPHVTYTGKRKANKLAAMLRVIGAIGIGAGSGLLLAETVSTDDPLTPEDEHFSSGYTYPTLIVGALFLAAGITVDVAVGGPKPETDATLCNPDATDVIVSRGGAKAGAGPTEMRSEYTYHEEEQSEIDTKVKQRIQNDMIAGFVTTLKEVRAQAPQQVAPPAPDAAAPTTPPAGAPPGQP
jgi:hypothetical protein